MSLKYEYGSYSSPSAVSNTGEGQVYSVNSAFRTVSYRVRACGDTEQVEKCLLLYRNAPRRKANHRRHNHSHHSLTFLLAGNFCTLNVRKLRVF